MDNTMTDDPVINARSGKRQFREMYDRYYPLLECFFRGRTNPEQVDNLLLQAWLRVCDHIFRLNRDHPLDRVWLFRTAIEVLKPPDKDLDRKALLENLGRFPHFEINTRDDLPPETGTKVRSALSSLPPRAKLLIEFTMLYGFSLKETAELLETRTEGLQGVIDHAVDRIFKENDLPLSSNEELIKHISASLPDLPQESRIEKDRMWLPVQNRYIQEGKAHGQNTLALLQPRIMLPLLLVLLLVLSIYFLIKKNRHDGINENSDEFHELIGAGTPETSFTAGDEGRCQNIWAQNIEGRVTILDAGGPPEINAGLNTAILPGDTLMTGPESTVSIAFESRVLLILYEKTALELSGPGLCLPSSNSDTVFELKGTGHASLSVMELPEEGILELRCSAGSISTLSGQFMVEVSDDITEIALFKGEAVFVPRGSTNETLISANDVLTVSDSSTEKYQMTAGVRFPETATQLALLWGGPSVLSSSIFARNHKSWAEEIRQVRKQLDSQ